MGRLTARGPAAVAALLRAGGRLAVAALLAGALLAGMPLAGCLRGDRSVEAASTTLSDVPAAVIAANERGVALLGMHRFDDAVAAFAEAQADGGAPPQVTVNRAIATMNRQMPGDEAAALALLDAVLAAPGAPLRAHYTAGLLRLRAGDPAAVDHFRRIVDADPDDAYAQYYLGAALELGERSDEALAAQQRAVALDPYLVSARYRAAQLLLRGGDRAAGRAMLESFRALDTNPLRRTCEWVYGKMGPMAEAVSLVVAAAAPPPEGPPFGDPVALVPGSTRGAMAQGPAPGTERAGRPLGATAADLDRDGRVDVVLLPAMEPGGDGNTTIALVREDDGAFRVDGRYPLAGVPRVRTALWGDLDGDGLTDVYLCRSGPNRMLRQTPDGRFEDVTAATGTAGGSFDTVDGALVDADHDGDLDVFLVNADGPDELLNDDRDGTYRPLAAERGLAGAASGPQAASTGVLFADLDGDRDADLVVLKPVPPHTVRRNELTWTWEPWPALAAFAETPAVAAACADLDGDGRPDLVTRTPGGALLRWAADADGVWTVVDRVDGDGATADDAPPEPAAARLLVLDVDGDGRPEVLDRSGRAWRVTRFGADGARSAPLDGAGPLLVDAVPLLLDPSAGPSLLEIPAAAPPLLRPPGSGRGRYAALALSGREDTGASMRSNASGIGTAWVARAGGRATVGSTYRAGTGPGQSDGPIAIGIGAAPAIDHLALVWSDGVAQSELALEAGVVHRIVETQRQLSSCPVLFAWDGERFAFVSDLLGVGGLGYLVAPGEYAPPRPRERFLLPEGLARPRDGRFVLQLAEPMEEACYLDRAALVAWDLPPGWDLVLDERMGILGPEPTGRALFFRAETLPARATGVGDADVLDRIGAADLVAAPVGDVDERFLGRLVAPQPLLLEFDRALDVAPAGTGPGEPVLVIDGWLEYPYSQTSFAAWQADCAYEAPTLEARGADGAWRVVAEQFGYPAGMPRRMAFPLDGLPPGCSALRLTTNQEIYWDRVAVAWCEPCPEAVRRELPLAGADLARVGYPRRSTGAQRVPTYDWDDRVPSADMRHLAGNYTAFGDVTALVAHADDALAIFGPGEAVALAFAAPAGAPPAGWTRRLVLDTEGWCKDMDLYTADGETLEPIPARGTPDAAARARMAQANVRWEWGD